MPSFDFIGQQRIGSTVLVVGTKANVDTAAVAVGSDTEQLREVTYQCDPDNTTGIFIGDTVSQPIQLNPGATITLPVAQVNVCEVKVNGSDTAVTVNYVGVVL